jgi:hypothetical protein
MQVWLGVWARRPANFPRRGKFAYFLGSLSASRIPARSPPDDLLAHAPRLEKKAISTYISLSLRVKRKPRQFFPAPSFIKTSIHRARRCGLTAADLFPEDPVDPDLVADHNRDENERDDGHDFKRVGTRRGVESGQAGSGVEPRRDQVREQSDDPGEGDKPDHRGGGKEGFGDPFPGGPNLDQT